MKLENHAVAAATHFMHYDLPRRWTVCMSPAIQVSVTDRLWSIPDEEHEPRAAA